MRSGTESQGSSPWAAPLAGFADDLREEARIYRDIGRETRGQIEALRQGDADRLMAIARRKQEALSRVGEIERRIDGAKRLWMERREEIPAALRARVQEALAEVEESLGALIALEEEAGSAIAGLRRETSDELRRIQANRRLRDAYAPGLEASAPRLLDGMH